MKQVSEEEFIEEDPYKNCSNGPLVCYFNDDLIVKDEEEENIVICKLAPCFLSRNEIGIHEFILDHFMENDSYSKAYYYLQRLLDKHVYACDLQKLEQIKKDKPHFKIEDLPPDCRVHVLCKHLKEDLRWIRYFKKKSIPGNLSADGIDKLNSYKTNFERKIDSILQLLKHLNKAERYDKNRKVEAQERSLKKIETMGKAGFNYTMKAGKEVDIDNEEDESILYADHPRFQEKKGIFAKEQEELEKEKKKKEDPK